MIIASLPIRNHYFGVWNFGCIYKGKCEWCYHELGRIPYFYKFYVVCYDCVVCYALPDIKLHKELYRYHGL